MERFRSLMMAVLLSGLAAGLVLFGTRHWLVVPLIQQAEIYESAAHDAMPEMGHEDEGWQPAEGFERIGLTGVSTVLSSIGFAAILFAAISLSNRPLDPWRGTLWGVAGFACFALAPALGLPPEPPGMAEADLQARQLWWAATAAATAIGLWLALGRDRHWAARIAGLAILVLPHIVGAPASEGDNLVPAELAHRFALMSLATSGLFWIALGLLAGFLHPSRKLDANDGRLVGLA